MCDSGRLELCYFVLKRGVQKKERGPEEEKRRRNMGMKRQDGENATSPEQRDGWMDGCSSGNIDAGQQGLSVGNLKLS